MLQIWRCISLVSRYCDWFGIDGNHYQREKHIGAIFYTMKDVRERKAYVITDWLGGSSVSSAASEINWCLAKGEQPVTEDEINLAIEKMAKSIEQNNENYCERFSD